MKTHLLFLMLVTVSTAFANIDTPVAAWDFNKIENGKVASTIGNFTATVIRQKHVSPSQGKIDSALAVRGKYKGSKAGALIVRNFKFDFAKPLQRKYWSNLMLVFNVINSVKYSGSLILNAVQASAFHFIMTP